MRQRKDIKLQDIAEALGVSVVTVSNALSNKKGVSDALRSSIYAKAQELGYKVKSQVPLLLMKDGFKEVAVENMNAFSNAQVLPLLSGATAANGGYAVANATGASGATGAKAASLASASVSAAALGASPFSAVGGHGLVSPALSELASGSLSLSEISHHEAVKSRYNFGIVISEIFVSEHPCYYMEIYNHLMQICSLEGCMVSLKFVPHAEEADLSSTFTFSNLDGLFVIGEISKHALAYIKEHIECKVVFIDNFLTDTPDFGFVQLDNFNGMYQLVKSLYDLNYRKFCFVGSINATHSILDRYLGYKRALEEVDDTVGAEFHIDDRNFASGPEIKVELPNEMPEIFVCNCDRTAKEVVKLLKEADLCDFNKIAIAGFDNFQSNLGDKSIYTFEHSPYVLAKTALVMMCDMIQGKNMPNLELISGKLLGGDTAPRRAKYE